MRSRLGVVLVGCLALLVLAVSVVAGCKKSGGSDDDAQVLDLNEKRVSGGVAGTAPAAPGATR